MASLAAHNSPTYRLLQRSLPAAAVAAAATRLQQLVGDIGWTTHREHRMTLMDKCVGGHTPCKSQVVSITYALVYMNRRQSITHTVRQLSCISTQYLHTTIQCECRYY